MWWSMLPSNAGRVKAQLCYDARLLYFQRVGRLIVLTVLTASVAASAPRSSVMPTSDCPAPKYPESRSVDAKLDVKISVRGDGTVGDVAMVTANPDQPFATATIDALRQWHFTPSDKQADSTRTYSTTIFLTPPQGMPLQFGVDRATRKRIDEHDGVVTIRDGQEWIYSALLFGDMDFTAEVRAATSTSALRVRAWPGSRNLPPMGYEIALASRTMDGGHPGLSRASSCGRRRRCTTPPRRRHLVHRAIGNRSRSSASTRTFA
jgi:hypothetical protein